MSLIRHSKQPSEDLLVINWWARMLVENEGHLVLGPGRERVKDLLNLIDEVLLFYDLDEDGNIWYAAWFEGGLLAAGGMSIWIAEARRSTRQALYNTLEALGDAFKCWPVVTVVTETAEKERLHQHLGFEPLGHVPLMYFGNTARISYMTNEHYPAVVEHFKKHGYETEAGAPQQPTRGNGAALEPSGG